MILSIIKFLINNSIILHYLCLCLVKINTREGNFFMVNDTISDLLTRIRNANLARHDTVDILNKK
jgi:hypothetical protein